MASEEMAKMVLERDSSFVVSSNKLDADWASSEY